MYYDSYDVYPNTRDAAGSEQVTGWNTSGANPLLNFIGVYIQIQQGKLPQDPLNYPEQNEPFKFRYVSSEDGKAYTLKATIEIPKGTSFINYDFDENPIPGTVGAKAIRSSDDQVVLPGGLNCDELASAYYCVGHNNLQ